MIKFLLKENKVKNQINHIDKMNTSQPSNIKSLFPKQYSVLEENYKSLSALHISAKKYVDFIKNENAKTMCDTGIQTIYREEGTLTDPFSPEEVVTKNTDPELLRIKHFKYGKELPPTMDELYYIEEMREKIAFDKSLPPMTDEASFELRRRLMEEQEIREWDKRENEKIKNENNKLKLLENVLIEREKEIEKEKNKQLKAFKSKQNEVKNQIVAKIQFRKQKILRKLNRLQKNFQNLKGKRDIIEEYSDHSSKVYAHIMREGISLDNLSEKFRKNPIALSNYEMYKELLGGLKGEHSTIDASLDAFLNKSSRKLFKLERHHINQLEKAYDELYPTVDMEKSNKVNDKYNLNIQNVVPRVDTPYLESRPELKDYPHQEVNLEQNRFEQEEKRIKKSEVKHRVATLMQKLLRGRALQNLMFDGKEKRLALIEELLIVANIEKIDEEQEKQVLQYYDQNLKEKAQVNMFKGKLVSDTADYLAKELVRFTEEKNVRNFIKEARKERNKREAVEIGRRQAERILKNKEDIMFNEVMQVHQESVDDYIDDIFDFSSAFICKKRAMEITQVKKKELEENWEKNNDNYEYIIKDFLHCFLIPNIDKQKLRKRIVFVEKRFSHIIKELNKKPFKDL